MIPPAALAVIAAAHEDTRRTRGSTRDAARAALRALRRAGWTITPTGVTNGPQTPA